MDKTIPKFMTHKRDILRFLFFVLIWAIAFAFVYRPNVAIRGLEYKEHQYVFDFMNDNEKLEIVKKSGVVVSIGSDCHRCKEYSGFRLYETYRFLKDNGIKTFDM